VCVIFRDNKVSLLAIHVVRDRIGRTICLAVILANATAGFVAASIALIAADFPSAMSQRILPSRSGYVEEFVATTIIQ